MPSLASTLMVSLLLTTAAAEPPAAAQTEEAPRLLQPPAALPLAELPASTAGLSGSDTRNRSVDALLARWPIPLRVVRGTDRRHDVALASHEEPVEDVPNDDGLKLPRRGATDEQPVQGPTAKTPGRALVSTAGSLGIVLGVFLVVVWFMRRHTPKALRGLSNDVVQVLGRAALTPKQQVHLVRLGNKLLLLSVTPAGAETLSEITDPQEVDRLTALCQQNEPGSIAASFRQVLDQLGREPAPSSFVDTAQRDDLQIAATEQRSAPDKTWRGFDA